MKQSLRICLWLLSFAPLVVGDAVFFPATTGKSLYQESLLVLASLVFGSGVVFSRAFRGEIKHKSHLLLRQPLVIAILSFFATIVVSTFLAVDRHGALWGNIERAEGLRAALYLLTFLILSALAFNGRDWVLFFKLSLVTTLVLLVKAFAEFSQGVPRPGSFIGHPTFLAGYLLFSCLSAAVVFTAATAVGWRVLSILVGALSIPGVFVTQTRGAIFGVFLGILAVSIHGLSAATKTSRRRPNLHRLSLIVSCLLAATLLVLFFTTASNDG